MLEALENMGCHFDGRIHSTRLKNRIFAHFEDFNEFKEGREVFLFPLHETHLDTVRGLI